MTALVLLTALAFGAPQDGPAPAPAPDPVEAPVDEPTAAAPLPRPTFGADPSLTFDSVAYERQMNLAVVGIGIGAASIPVAVAGVYLVFLGTASQEPLPAFGGLLLATAGGAAYIVGPSLTVAGALFAARRLQEAGVDIPATAGWIGFGTLIAGVVFAVGPALSYIGSGIQMALNGNTLRSNGLAVGKSTVRWMAHVDPKTGALRVSGLF